LPESCDLLLFNEIEDLNKIKEVVNILNKNRFCCVIVTDKKTNGFSDGLVFKVIREFENNGFVLYNEAVFVFDDYFEQLNNFKNNRIVKNLHKNILIFANGDVKNYKKDFEDVDLTGLEQTLVDGKSETTGYVELE
jgi:hypothetical protein